MTETMSDEKVAPVAPQDAELAMEVEGLQTFFFTRQGIVKAVDDVSFYLKKGETLGIVGESGCGKSITALSVMRLVPDPPGKTVGGSVKLDGRSLLELSDDEMRDIRGNEMSMIFQEPMTSLNPVFTIGARPNPTNTTCAAWMRRACKKSFDAVPLMMTLSSAFMLHWPGARPGVVEPQPYVFPWQKQQLAAFMLIRGPVAFFGTG